MILNASYQWIFWIWKTIFRIYLILLFIVFQVSNFFFQFSIFVLILVRLFQLRRAVKVKPLYKIIINKENNTNAFIVFFNMPRKHCRLTSKQRTGKVFAKTKNEIFEGHTNETVYVFADWSMVRAHKLWKPSLCNLILLLTKASAIQNLKTFQWNGFAKGLFTLQWGRFLCNIWLLLKGFRNILKYYLKGAFPTVFSVSFAWIQKIQDAQHVI